MSWIAGNELYLLLGIGVLFNILWLSEFKKKLDITSISVFAISILHTIAGVLSVKLFAFLEGGEPGGMSLYGGIFFMPVLYYLGAKIFKRNVADVFDIFAICMIFTVMCARINCLISGCCMGLPIPGTEGLFWPTRQLEIIFYIILLVILGRRVSRKSLNGIVYPIYMMSYGLFRFVTEWFRESSNLIGWVHVSHIWSIIAFVIGACIYIYLSKYNEGKKHMKKEGKKK